MEHLSKAVIQVSQSASAVDSWNALAVVMFLNTLAPWSVIFTGWTSPYNNDCYDSCGLTTLFILNWYWMVSLLLWGIPFFFMGIYKLFGQGEWVGKLLKFQIVYSTRYLGLFWHIIGSLLAVGLALAEWDLLFWLVFAVTGFWLELMYTKYGAGAVQYIDPEWTQGENTLYPFTV